MSTTPRHHGRRILGGIATFVCTLLIARVLVDLAQYGALWRPESWSSAAEWIAPLGFAVIGVFAYWYSHRRAGKNHP
ncbi:MAG: hypothetical protein PT944_06750 [Actinomycetaceae bacterium]|nr:hypothetical protein [Arcanobacterium sp.]MDD7687590.1 hypothetical protein [Actinomycetaceae bacterium]MDY5273172.1 hypothetical protein [Arcanobacterium sp.]